MLIARDYKWRFELARTRLGVYVVSGNSVYVY